MPDLRWRLRTETRDAHASIDELYGQHDLSTRDGLTFVLVAHLMALTWIHDVLPAHLEAEKQALDAMINDIAADLAGLDAPFGLPMRVAGSEYASDPLGLIYVVAGSRLGARILVRQIESSPDPIVRKACRYFQSVDGDALWQDCRAQLQTWAGEPVEQDDVVAAARAGFACFERAHRDTQRILLDNVQSAGVA